MTTFSQPPPLESAQAVARRRIMPLPLRLGEKNPNRPGWQEERIDPADLAKHFNGAPMNVGMRLGHILSATGRVLTDRFMDADLDSREAIRAAPYFLPKTAMVWGRASKPRSHYGYRLTSAEGVKSYAFTDPMVRRSDQTKGGPKAMLCELRWTGQTVAPGSVNRASGHDELVRWEEGMDGDPSEVDAGPLVGAMGMVAAVALLARYWSEGVRHQASLPLAGLLCRGGMLEPDAVRFVTALCDAANDPQLDDRLRSVHDTYAHAAHGEPYTAGHLLGGDAGPEDHHGPSQVAGTQHRRVWRRRGAGREAPQRHRQRRAVRRAVGRRGAPLR